MCDKSAQFFGVTDGFCSSVLASSSAWLPLLYDTIVFALVVMKTLPSIRDRYRGFTARLIMTRLLEDGLIYYTCVSPKVLDIDCISEDIFPQGDFLCHTGANSHDHFRQTWVEEYHRSVR